MRGNLSFWEVLNGVVIIMNNLLALFRNEAPCKIFIIKNKFDLHENELTNETRFINVDFDSF